MERLAFGCMDDVQGVGKAFAFQPPCSILHDGFGATCVVLNTTDERGTNLGKGFHALCSISSAHSLARLASRRHFRTSILFKYLV